MEVFKLIVDLDDDTGLTFNALVDRPAHNKSLIAFDKEGSKKLMHFNDSKRMITGVAISANQLIFRSYPNLGNYYVYFEPTEVEKMVRKMSRQQLLSSVNLMHDSKKVVKGITFMEGYFVSDSKRPLNDSENVQNGSYVMTYYVEDEGLYNEIKGGRYVGYSVEGIFDQIPMQIKKSNINQKSNKMKKVSLSKLIFGKEKFAEATTADGVVLTYEGELEVGTAVFVMDAEGNSIAAPEGSHTLEDGRTIVLDGSGIVTEVVEVEEEAAPEDVELSEVIAVMQEMAKQIKTLEAKFSKFQEEKVPGAKKFSRKEGAKTWKDLTKEVK